MNDNLTNNGQANEEDAPMDWAQYYKAQRSEYHMGDGDGRIEFGDARSFVEHETRRLRERIGTLPSVPAYYDSEELLEISNVLRLNHSGLEDIMSGGYLRFGQAERYELRWPTDPERSVSVLRLGFEPR